MSYFTQSILEAYQRAKRYSTMIMRIRCVVFGSMTDFIFFARSGMFEDLKRHCLSSWELDGSTRVVIPAQARRFILSDQLRLIAI
jgi:hypothetical protein